MTFFLVLALMSLQSLSALLTVALETPHLLAISLIETILKNSVNVFNVCL